MPAGAQEDGGVGRDAVPEGERGAVHGANVGVDGDDEVTLFEEGVGDGEGGGAGDEEVAATLHAAVAADVLAVDEDAVAAAELGDGKGEVMREGGDADVGAVPDLVRV